jgi:chromosome partitioning protein
LFSALAKIQVSRQVWRTEVESITMAAKAIAFINFKGGVGKTAATVNIGACLAYYRRKRVLIVDLDAQCNSSFWLMPPRLWKEHIGNGERSTYQLFRDAIVK